VVEGSVQKTEDRIRITAQLIDAKTGHHVWAHTYDRELKDIFDLQDEITMKIMTAVGLRLLDGEEFGEIHPPSGNLEVVKKAWKAVDYFWRTNKEGNILARQELEEAISLDPEYPGLYSLLAITYLYDVYLQSSDSPLVSLAKASKNIKKALALDDEDYTAHIALAALYESRKEPDKAIAAYERAIAINPNGALAYAHLGNFLSFTGKHEEGIKLIEKAMQLDPIPPARYLIYLAGAYSALGRYDDGIELLREVLERSPNNMYAHLGLTSAYSVSGREKEARHQAQKLLRVDPSFSLDRYAEAVLNIAYDEVRAEQHIDNLRKAGLK
jgi:adenylate cyclase